MTRTATMLALGLALLAVTRAKPCPAADANLKSLNKGDGRVSVTFRSQIDEELQVYWMTMRGAVRWVPSMRSRTAAAMAL